MTSWPLTVSEFPSTAHVTWFASNEAGVQRRAKPDRLGKASFGSRRSCYNRATQTLLLTQACYMERKFNPTIRAGHGHTYIRIQGVIDEDNALAELTNQLQGSVLLLDLAEVERINSCGVRDWVNWLNNLTAMGLRVVMMRCSPAIINQVNMVTNFSGDAIIHSFFAPYFNPETDEEKSVLLFTRDLIGQRPVKAPRVTCEETGYPMEFDDCEESYFAFVGGLGDLDRLLDPGILQTIQSLTPEYGRRGNFAPTFEVDPTPLSTSTLAYQASQQALSPSEPEWRTPAPSHRSPATQSSAGAFLESAAPPILPSRQPVDALSASGIDRAFSAAPPPKPANFVSSRKEAESLLVSPSLAQPHAQSLAASPFLFFGLGVALTIVVGVLLWLLVS